MVRDESVSITVLIPLIVTLPFIAVIFAFIVVIFAVIFVTLPVPIYIKLYSGYSTRYYLYTIGNIFYSLVI